jgi:hypothetical protein
VSGSTLDPLVLLLAVLGGAALLLRALGGLFRLALRASQETAARELAEVSARRGDITGMEERRRAAAAARQDRRRHLLLTLLWIAWFVLPLMLGAARIPFALASLLWLLPKRGPGSPSP